jgi:transcriptional regulator
VTDAPGDYVAATLRAIRAFEIVLTRIEGKWKMSQNRSEADRDGVISALGHGDDRDRAVHDEMRRLYPDAG